jgi:hypothetical protein
MSSDQTNEMQVNDAGLEKNNLHASAFGVMLNRDKFEPQTVQSAEVYLRCLFNKAFQDMSEDLSK